MGKKIRGRFFIAVGFPGLNWTCASAKDQDLTPTEVAAALREYAAFIDGIDKPAQEARSTDGQPLQPVSTL